MGSNYEKIFYRDYEIVVSENEKLQDELAIAIHKYRLIEYENKRLQEQNEALKREQVEADAQIEALKEKTIELQREVDRMKAIANADGTNSGIPTSQTPINRKKVIPNTRKKSDKPKGGQVGHKKQSLKPFAEEEINEVVFHASEKCPKCGGEMHAVENENAVSKDELDYRVVIVKRRHVFPESVCNDCGHREKRLPIPEHLKEPIQYGTDIQSCALTLMNIGNVSMNKVKRIVYGLTDGGINFCEGYIAKLQRRAADGLKAFIAELKAECLKSKLLYWDDTVIGINTARGCLRFYGNERFAYYTAHLHKDKEGLDKDGILSLLPKETTVVHDHNRVNYHDDYVFRNAECNVHLLRDLQRVTDNSRHPWSAKLAELIRKTDCERNEAIGRNETAFPDEYVESFNAALNEIMINAAQENADDEKSIFKQEENALILRLMKYRIEYFAWVVCFDIPFSNNLSERSLRSIKSKMKIAGQFQNEGTAMNYATIRSYIETCRRNQVNETEALIRLCKGTPFSLHEILAIQSTK